MRFSSRRPKTDDRRLPMRNWSIPIGRLFGVEIRVHLTFVFLLGFVWMAESAIHTADKSTSAPTPTRVLALIGIIFRVVIPAGLGAALVARARGTPSQTCHPAPHRRYHSHRGFRQLTSP